MGKRSDTNPASKSARCPSCGATADASDRFCRQCGTSLSNEAGVNGGVRRLVGLRAFGLAVVAFALFYAFLHYGRSGARDSTVPSQPISITDVGRMTGSAETTPDLSQRETADALFNQAMTAYESGDSVGTRQFVPMAIAAYQQLDALDPDAHYHLALLGLAADRPEDALAQADTILAEVPNHLLGLSVAARSYDRLGRSDLAVEYFERFLEAYTPEVAASRPEYIDHARALPGREQMAREYLREHSGTSQGSKSQ